MTHFEVLAPRRSNRTVEELISKRGAIQCHFWK